MYLFCLYILPSIENAVNSGMQLAYRKRRLRPKISTQSSLPACSSSSPSVPQVVSLLFLPQTNQSLKGTALRELRIENTVFLLKSKVAF
jgi:hypothetical protein